MAQEDLVELFTEVLKQIATEIVTFLPKIILVAIVIIILIIAIKLINKIFSGILKFANIDQIIKKIVKIDLPFSVSNLIIGLIDLGIILIAVFGLADFFLPLQHMEIMRMVFNYIARIASVIAITLFTFVMFNVLIERVRIETPMRGYIVFILLVIVTMLVVDLTNLSTSTKNALVGGLSIGLGISIGVFAIWFFFHDYLERYLKLRSFSIKTRTKDSLTQLNKKKVNK